MMRNQTPTLRTWTRAFKHPSFATGLCIVLILILSAVMSAFWSPYPVADIDIPNKLARPSAQHWFGTDSLGRDIASMLWVGSQNTLLVGLIAVGIGLSIGVPLGLLASAKRGLTEEVTMRAADFTFAFPALLSAILLTAIYGPGLVISITAIGIFNIPVFARITRGAANAIWTRDYALAAKAAGKSEWRITWNHVLPNMASVLIVQASVQFAIAILAEAALSYLGLGTQAPQPSWGRMLNEAQSQMFQAPWLAVYPGMAIAIAVLGLNLLGDGLRDLMDPRLARLR
jgi:peptide/nickel transport system permease protein